MRVVVEQVDKQVWELVWPVEWNGITVPAGFHTDFYSTPWFLWWLLPPTGAYVWPAVVHDYLYCVDTGITRRQADRAFLDAMKSAGVPRWQRWLVYAGVRIGGVHRGHWSR